MKTDIEPRYPPSEGGAPSPSAAVYECPAAPHDSSLASHQGQGHLMSPPQYSQLLMTVHQNPAYAHYPPTLSAPPSAKGSHHQPSGGSHMHAQHATTSVGQEPSNLASRHSPQRGTQCGMQRNPVPAGPDESTDSPRALRHPHHSHRSKSPTSSPGMVPPHLSSKVQQSGCQCCLCAATCCTTQKVH